MSVPGFPNMFLLYGPNTNGGTGSVIYTIEAGVGARDRGAAASSSARHARRIEVRAGAGGAVRPRTARGAADTVWHTGCTSWYVDENGNDPEPVAVAVEHLPPPHGDDRPSRLPPRARPRRAFGGGGPLRATRRC